jgi:acyl transferase domain-containing protein/acyl carrier protein
MKNDPLHTILSHLKGQKITESEALAQFKQLVAAKNMAIEPQALPPQLSFAKLYSDADILLKGHKIFGKTTLMGVAHLSLVLQALDLNVCQDKVIEIHKILMTSALSLEHAEKSVVNAVLNAESDHGYNFKNSYRKMSDAEETLSAQGKLLLREITPYQTEDTLDLAALTQVKNSLRSDIFYQAEGQAIYDNNLHNVKAIHYLNHELIGEIELTPGVLQEIKDYKIHPAIFDAIHVVIAFAIAPTKPLDAHWPPLLIKKVIIAPQALSMELVKGYAKVQTILRTDEMTESNVKFYGPAGQLLITIEGFCTKRVPDAERLFNSAKSTRVKTTTKQNPLKNTDLTTVINSYVVNKFVSITGIEPDKTKNFMMLGIDSNAMIHLVKEIEDELSIELYPTLFFERENIAQLVAYFTEEHAAAFHHLITEDIANDLPIDLAIASPSINQPQQNITLAHRARLNDSSSTQAIAVIGMAGRVAGAKNLDEFWQNLIASRDMITEVPEDHWDYKPWFSENPDLPNKTYSKWGSFLTDVDKFDANFFEMSGREAVWTDPQLRLLLEVFQETIDDAGVGQTIQGSQTGVYVGSCFHEYWDEVLRAQTPMIDYEHHSSIMSMLSARVSYCYDLRGCSIPLDNACASSLTALHLACQGLLNNENDMAFVAGVNLILSPLHHVYFSRMRALSPTGHCYSFDERGDGYVPGEGILGVLLKPLDKALADGDQVHAIIKGSAINHVGRANNPTSPRPEQQVALLKQAWDKANIHPETLSYIEAHGTGTKLGDPIEINSLKQAFKFYTQKETFCAIGSAKSHIGHLEAAAGLAGVIKVILSMQHAKIPRMPMFAKQNPFFKLENSPLFINTEAMAWEPTADTPRRAGINSFGMTGNNAHVVIEEAPKRTLATQQAKPYYLFALSAKHPDSLQQQVENLACYLHERPGLSLEAIAYTLNAGRKHFAYRHSIIAASAAELLAKLANLTTDFANQDRKITSLDSEADKHVLASALTELTLLNLAATEPYKKLLTQISSFYLQGYSIDWKLLHAGEAQQKISLPAYAFLKQRYWVDRQTTKPLQMAEAPLTLPINTGNPQKIKLMPTENLPTTQGLRQTLVEDERTETHINFSLLLQYDDFICLQAHQVFNHSLLPTDAYIEILAVVWQAVCSDKAFAIKDLQLVNPLLSSKGASHRLKINLHFTPVGYQFRIVSKDTELLHAKGLISASQNSGAPAPAEFSLNALKALPYSIASETIYNDGSLAYFGKFYQVVHGLRYEADRALAHLVYPEQAKILKNVFRINVSVLNGMVVAALAFANLKTKLTTELFLPMAIQAFELYETLVADEYYAVIQLRTMAVDEIIFDVQLLTIAGLIIAEMKGLAVRKATQATLGKYLAMESNIALEKNSMSQKDAKTIMPQLSQCLAETLQLTAESLDRSKNFQEYGMDSILTLEFLKRIKEQFKFLESMNAAQIYAYPNLTKLAEYIASQDIAAISENQLRLKPSFTPALEKNSSSQQDYKAVTLELSQCLADTLQLTVESLDTAKNFQEYGMDSILTLEFLKRIKEQFKFLASMNAAQIYAYPNLVKLAQYIASQDIAPIIENQISHKLIADSAANCLPLTIKHNATAMHNNKPAAEQATYAREDYTAAVLRVPTPVESEAGSIPQGKVDIAIVGMAGRFPEADDVESFWSLLSQGESAIKEIPLERWNLTEHYDADPAAINKTYGRKGGFLNKVENFDANFFSISPHEAELMDAQQRLFLEESWKALEDAGYAQENLSGKKCGIFVGAAGGDYNELLAQAGLSNEAYAFMGMSSAILSSRLAYHLDLRGPCLALDTACSSSLVALHLACESLRSGECDIALAGGVTLMLTPQLHIKTAKAGMLSQSDSCRTFDQKADGIVLGEAVGVVVLKPLSAAIKDKDRIYGVIKGSGLNQDGRSNGITAPNPEAQTELETSVYNKFHINPRDISYVEAHGTGTKLGDPIEISALTKAFQAYNTDKQYCAIGSVKPNIGHTTLAAGIASVIKVLLCLQHKQLAPSINYTAANEYIDFANSPFYVNTQLKTWDTLNNKPRLAAVSSFGFSGTNAHVVIEEWPEQTAMMMQNKPYYILTLSAKDSQALQQRRQDLQVWLQQHVEYSLESIAFNLNMTRSHFKYRFAIVVASKEELKQKLGQIEQGQKPAGYYQGISENEPADKAIFDKVLQLTTEELKVGDKSQTNNYCTNLQALANLYTKGYDLAWHVIHQNENDHKIRLPSYPFSRQRYWVPAEAKNNAQTASPPLNFKQAQARLSKAKGQLFSKQWQLNSLLTDIKQFADKKLVLLVNAHTLEFAKHFAKQANSALLLDAEQLMDAQVITKVTSFVQAHEALLLCDLSDIKVDEALEHSFKYRVKLLQQLLLQDYSAINILHVTQGLPYMSVKTENLALSGALMAGLVKVLPAEYVKLKAKTIDMDTLSFALINEFSELQKDNYPIEICYLQDERYTPAIQPIISPFALNYSEHYKNSPLNKNKIYVITGGVRGIGAAIAEYLVSQGVRKLILIGQQPVPPQHEWQKLISAQTLEDALLKKITWLQSLVDRKVFLQVYTGELAYENLTAAISDIRSQGDMMGGVIHCAGIIKTDNPAFIQKDWQEFATVMRPKVSCLQTLHEIFKADKLDFFVLFSSVASQLPSLAVGFSDYAVANNYMDLFALMQRAQGYHYYQSLNWPSWIDVGIGEATSPRYKQLGLAAHYKEEAFVLLQQSLQYLAQYGQIIPAIQPTVEHFRDWLLPRLPLTDKVSPIAQQGNKSAVSKPTQNFADKVIDWLKSELAQLCKLKAEVIDNHTTFGNYGVDSILIASLVRKLEKHLQASIEPGLILEYPTVALLAEHLIRTYPEKIASLVQAATGDAPASAINTQADARLIAVSPTHHQPIAVIGLACHFPGANNKEEFWHNLTAGICSVREAPGSRWDTHKHYSQTPQAGKSMSKWGGFLEGIEYFDPHYFGIAAEDALFVDPLIRQCLEVSVEALADAGYEPEQIAGRRAGVFMGARASHYVDKVGPLQKNSITGLGQNFISAMLSHVLNLTGPSMVIDTACSSSLVSIHQACQSLLQGECELAFAGGVDILLDEQIYIHLSQAKALSPDGLCHTFDEKANGFVPGEGCGMVILKPLARAIADGDSIYGIIEASAINNDGKTMGVTTPNPQAQQAVIETALAQANINPATISYVETHGTGTLIGDPIELKALTQVFNLRSAEKQYCAVGSVKSNLGHLLSAAGIAGFIKVMLALQHKQLPPTLHCHHPNPRFAFKDSPFYPNTQLSDWQPRENMWRAGISSFGFGGTNAHLVMQSFRAEHYKQYQQRREPLAPPLFDKQWYWFTGKSQEGKQVVADAVMGDFFELVKRA